MESLEANSDGGSSNIRGIVVRVSVSLAALGILLVLFYRLGPDNVLFLLRQIGWNFLVVVLIYALQEYIRAVALVHCLRGETRPPFRDIVYITLIGEAVRAVTLAGPLLSEPIRAWLIRRHGVPSSEAIAAIAVEYTSNTAVSALFTIAGAAYLLHYLEPPKDLRILANVLLYGSVGFLAIGFAFVIRRGHTLVVIASGAAGRLAALEFTAQFLLLVETYWALKSMGLMTSFMKASLIETLTKIANVAIAGVAEGAYAFIFRAFALPAAAGFALSLVKRLRSMAIAVIGLGVIALIPDHGRRR
jgi:hypothetical protein